MKLLEDMPVGFYFFNYAAPPNKEWVFLSPFHDFTHCLTFKIRQIKKFYTVPRTVSNYVFIFSTLHQIYLRFHK